MGRFFVSGLSPIDGTSPVHKPVSKVNLRDGLFIAKESLILLYGAAAAVGVSAPPTMMFTVSVSPKNAPFLSLMRQAL